VPLSRPELAELVVDARAASAGPRRAIVAAFARVTERRAYRARPLPTATNTDRVRVAARLTRVDQPYADAALAVGTFRAGAPSRAGFARPREIRASILDAAEPGEAVGAGTARLFPAARAATFARRGNAPANAAQVPDAVPIHVTRPSRAALRTTRPIRIAATVFLAYVPQTLAFVALGTHALIEAAATGSDASRLSPQAGPSSMP
jgi:hypothetical protein